MEFGAPDPQSIYAFVSSHRFESAESACWRTRVPVCIRRQVAFQLQIICCSSFSAPYCGTRDRVACQVGAARSKRRGGGGVGEASADAGAEVVDTKKPSTPEDGLHSPVV